MNDLSFIAQIKDEPLALLVLGAMVLFKIFDALVKYAPQFFSKEKRKPVGQWQDFVSERISEIETKLEKLFSIVSIHEQFSSKISEGTLVNQLFSDELWPFLRLKAFRRLLAMRKNGRIWDKGFNLILNHKEDWLNVLDTELGTDIVDEEFYNARLTEIRKRIYDDFVKV